MNSVSTEAQYGWTICFTKQKGNREALVYHVNSKNLQLPPPPFTFLLSLSFAAGLRGTPGSYVLPLIARSHKRCGGYRKEIDHY